MDPSRKQTMNRMMIPNVIAGMLQYFPDLSLPKSGAEFRKRFPNLLPQDYQLARIVNLNTDGLAHRNLFFPVTGHAAAP